MSIMLAIDGGLANLGWAVVRLTPASETLEAAGCISTKKSDKKRGVLSADDNVRRARELARSLLNLWELYGPSVMAVEAQSSPRNASAAGKLAMSLGVVAAFAEMHRVPIVSASPKEVRAAMGKAASKGDVEAAVIRSWPVAASALDSVVKAKREHIADACAVAIACLPSDAVCMARRL